MVGVTSLTGLGVASAQSVQSGEKAAGLVQKIAQKFNLSEDDVQAVFDQDQSERETEHQQVIEEKLTQAVTDGKITEAQKQAILTKLSQIKADHQSERDSMKDLTRDERKALMESKRAELEAWAKENNIPTDYLRLFGGRGHGGPVGPPPGDVDPTSNS